MIIIHLTVTPWNVGQTMSRQAMAMALSKCCKNLYYRPPKPISITELPQKKIFSGTLKINENLIVLNPSEMQGKLYRYQPLEKTQFNRQVKWLKKKIKSVSEGEDEKVVLYVWHHTFLPLIKEIKHDALIYHIYDDVFMYNKAKTDEEERKADRQLIDSADVVVVVGKDLAEWKKVNRPWIPCPGGVDTDLFKPQKSDLKKIGIKIKPGRKTAGYFGMINSKINLPLLKEIVQKASDFHFIFAGLIGNMGDENKKIWNEIEKAENVNHLGVQSQTNLVRLYNALDVGFMPYCHESGWSVFAIPLKLSEFMACGKPVVSTPLIPLKEYQDYVRLEETAEGFIQAFNDLLAADSVEEVENRLQFAKENSWENRAKLICAEINSDKLNQNF